MNTSNYSLNGLWYNKWVITDDESDPELFDSNRSGAWGNIIQSLGSDNLIDLAEYYDKYQPIIALRIREHTNAHKLE